MYKIDIAIDTLRASLDSLRKGRAAAEEAQVPVDQVLALEQMETSLAATIDELQQMGLSRGAEEKFTVPKALQLDLSRKQEPHTED